MKKLLHRGYFWEQFKQLRTPGIVLAGILMLMNLFYFVSNISTFLNQELSTIPSESIMAFPMMGYVYAASLVLTFIGFNWLNRRSSSDFYHALPIKRTTIYCSTYLAISVWMCIGLTAYALVYLGINLLLRLPFNYLSFLFVYLNMLIGVIYVVGIVSLSCSLSGTRFVNIFASVAILLMPRILLTVMAGFVSERADHLVVLQYSFLFNPSYNLFATPYMVLAGALDGDVISFHNALAMLYSLVHAFLLALLGCVAFKVRPSESAGMPMRSKLLQGVIRTAIGLPLLLVLAYAIAEDSFHLTGYVVLGVLAFTFYCLYELISTKSAKRMLKSMPLFTICIGIAALYLFVPMLIAKASATVVVDESNIASFEILKGSNDYVEQLRNDVKIDDPQGIRYVAAAYRRTIDHTDMDLDYQTGRYATVRIHRKSGGDLIRYLHFTTKELDAIEIMTLQDEAFVEQATQFPQGNLYFSASNLSYAEAREIAKILIEEYNALNEEEQEIAGYGDNFWRFSETDFSRSYFVLSVRGTRGFRNFSKRYAITDLTPKAAQRYAELLYEKNGKSAAKQMDAYLNWMETGNGIRGRLHIGTQMELNLYNSFWGYDDFKSLPKVTDPEYYEILQILKDAETTSDMNEGVTVSFGNYNWNDSYMSYIGSLLDIDSSGSTDCVVLKLSDEQISRIRDLLHLHEMRLNKYQLPDTYDTDDILAG